MRFKITLGEKSLGLTRLIDDSRPETLDFHSNRVYVCPQCGAAWARWEAEEKRQWFSFARSCQGHPTGLWHGDRAGSLVLYPADLVVAPREMLEHELLVVSNVQVAWQQYPDKVGEPE